MEEEIDLFEDLTKLPQEVRDILLTFEDETYAECERLEQELLPHGYTFEWGLGAEPFNLSKLD